MDGINDAEDDDDDNDGIDDEGEEEKLHYKLTVKVYPHYHVDTSNCSLWSRKKTFLINLHQYCVHWVLSHITWKHYISLNLDDEDDDGNGIDDDEEDLDGDGILNKGYLFSTDWIF